MDASGHAIVVDDLPIARAGIAAVLRELGVEVRAETHSARQAATLCALDAPRPDPTGAHPPGAHPAGIVVLGAPADLPVADAARRLARLRPRPAVVALLGPGQIGLVAYLLALGVQGLVRRNGSTADLAAAVAAAGAGERYVAEGLQAALPGVLRARTAPPDHGLTPREREVLVLLAQGRTNREIAHALSVTVATVKSHLVHVYAKLGATSRNEALGRAVALGLLR